MVVGVVDLWPECLSNGDEEVGGRGDEEGEGADAVDEVEGHVGDGGGGERRGAQREGGVRGVVVGAEEGDGVRDGGAGAAEGGASVALHGCVLRGVGLLLLIGQSVGLDGHGLRLRLLRCVGMSVAVDCMFRICNSRLFNTEVYRACGRKIELSQLDVKSFVMTPGLKSPVMVSFVSQFELEVYSESLDFQFKPSPLAYQNQLSSSRPVVVVRCLSLLLQTMTLTAPLKGMEG